MSDPLVAILKNRASKFPTLAGVVLPQARMEVDASVSTSPKMPAMIPFVLYRLRAAVTMTTSVAGTWNVDMQLVSLDDGSAIASSTFSFPTIGAAEGQVSIVPVNYSAGYYLSDGSNDEAYTEGSTYKITAINDGVFSTAADARLPATCQEVIPQLLGTEVGSGDSGIVDWYLIVDILTEL